MNNLIYIFKNILFRNTKEAAKLKRPVYKDLIRYENFQRKTNNKLALSFAAGRSGQNWFSKIFNSHSNWIGSCERFADFEAFYRYVSYYKLPIYKEGFFKLIELSSKRDMSLYQNSFISSPYLSFGVEELTKKLKPNYIFFNLRHPIQTVESLHKKGWYINFDNQNIIKSPLVDFSQSQYRSFSRIVPKGEYLDKWSSLSRIGKITWFWSTINKAIFDDFNKIKNTDKFYIKLEDVHQNYDTYEKLANKFNFQNKMTKNKFLGAINKAPNKGSNEKYFYKEWNNLEKKEFDIIINEIFPYYDKIKTNL
tara:strand:- start:42 stop:965 length:924 start_codon:yes stop_codon:yes gene_type:complete